MLSLSGGLPAKVDCDAYRSKDPQHLIKNAPDLQPSSGAVDPARWLFSSFLLLENTLNYCEKLPKNSRDNWPFGVCFVNSDGMRAAIVLLDLARFSFGRFLRRWNFKQRRIITSLFSNEPLSSCVCYFVSSTRRSAPGIASCAPHRSQMKSSVQHFTTRLTPRLANGLNHLRCHWPPTGWSTVGKADKACLSLSVRSGGAAGVDPTVVQSVISF